MIPSTIDGGTVARSTIPVKVKAALIRET